MKKLMIGLTIICILICGGCKSGKIEEQGLKKSQETQPVAKREAEIPLENGVSDSEINSESTSFVADLTEEFPEKFKSEIESADSNNEEPIILIDGEEGEYGQYDLFDGEPYLRYYIPAGEYKVKCNKKGGFYVETIELHKEDGWDTPTTILQVTMSDGEETEISVREGQCISLYLRTEIELITR